jgi:MFS family permease
MHPQVCIVKVSILCFVALIDSFGYTLLVNVLPNMVDKTDPLYFPGLHGVETGTAYALLQFSFVLGATLFPPIAGHLSDKYGRRAALLLSLSCLSLAYWCLSFISSLAGFLSFRFISGVTGGLRPVAISYIADMVKDECARGRLISSLSLLSAFSVGFGPSIGARLANHDRAYPFMFMSGLSFLGLLAVVFFLPELRPFPPTRPASRRTSICETDLYCSGNSLSTNPLSFIYRSLLILGFSTYFMAMMGAIAFPLSLKNAFHFDPITAGLCSIGDGPLIFIANLMFMNRLSHSLSVACKASFFACISLALIHFVPTATDDNSLPLFLSLKYLTSAAAPIAFCAIPQILINICPLGSCGTRTGILTGTHGFGRLLATAIVGPLFAINPALVYNMIAITGLLSGIVFLILHKSLERFVGKSGLKTPLLFGHSHSVVATPATSPRATSPELERTSSVALTLLMPDVTTVETAAAVLLQQLSFQHEDGDFH